MYNTGDLGKWRDDGQLEHLGRADDQVRARIVSLLQHHPLRGRRSGQDQRLQGRAGWCICCYRGMYPFCTYGYADSLLAPRQTAEGVIAASALLIEKELVGFVTPDKVDIELVKAAVARIQPYYANPSRYLTMAEFPKTTNGLVPFVELPAHIILTRTYQEDR